MDGVSAYVTNFKASVIVKTQVLWESIEHKHLGFLLLIHFNNRQYEDVMLVYILK